MLGTRVIAAPYHRAYALMQLRCAATNIAATHEPAAVEKGRYEKWESSGSFRPSGAGKAFSMVVPPPNITGKLHLGHALTYAIQDTFVRFHRMNGADTLWVPGTDHAGIATQTRVEAELARRGLPPRRDQGRDAFLAHVWEWAEKYKGEITGQVRRMGASLDWGREVFTLDPARAAAVTEAFVRLHEKGLIARRARIVNWVPALQSVISDIEVDSHPVAPGGTVEVPVRGKKHRVPMGVIHSVAYALEHPSGDVTELVAATTRPETIFGDVAVAVHPWDKRYKHLIGQRVRNPLTGALIPIVDDAALVDMTQGTGVVKVTPGHDLADYMCMLRHVSKGLRVVNILNPDGTLNDAAEGFRGEDRLLVRPKIVAALTASGSYRGSKPHALTLSICSRSGDVVEPLVRPQWFVDCRSMAARAAAAVKDGSLRLVPERHGSSWAFWLENSPDWCISRQLWWGHQVPAYRVVRDGDASGAEAWEKDEEWIVARTEEEALAKAKAQYGATVRVVRDEDVLDTWFSSGIFPISALGWPAETEDMKKYYPLSLMETGSDILFFWVARMVMMCTELTGKLPFHTVALHPMIRDAQGRKMSKSLGNVIEPEWLTEGLPLAQLIANLEAGALPAGEKAKSIKGMKANFPKGIPGCGTDGLRFGLLSYTQQGVAINIDVRQIEAARSFCNKIWNATRFVVTANEATPASTIPVSVASMELMNSWLDAMLQETITAVHHGVAECDLSEGALSLRKYFVTRFCDVYLEWAKAALASAETRQKTLEKLESSLTTYLRAAHPFLPYVTEALNEALPDRLRVPALITAAYPAPGATPDSNQSTKVVESVLALVHGIRMQAPQLPKGTPLSKVTLTLHTNDSNAVAWNHLDIARALLRNKTLAQGGQEEASKAKLLREVVPGVSVAFHY